MALPTPYAAAAADSIYKRQGRFRHFHFEQADRYHPLRRLRVDAVMLNIADAYKRKLFLHPRAFAARSQGSSELW